MECAETGVTPTCFMYSVLSRDAIYKLTISIMHNIMEVYIMHTDRVRSAYSAIKGFRMNSYLQHYNIIS